MKVIQLFIILFSSSFLNAQHNYDIKIHNDVLRIEENINTFKWNEMPASSKFQNGYYGWIQFYNTPTQAIQDEFENRGLVLIDYLPTNTYTFYFPKDTPIQYLKDSGARAITPIEGKYKL